MKFQNSEIKTVWLDLDDTLIDFHTNSRLSLELLYSQFNLSQWFNTAEKWIETYQTGNHALWALYSNAKISRDELRRSRFINPLTQAGMPAKQAGEMWIQLDKTYLDLLARQRTLIPGALHLLEELRKKHVRIAILSNGFKEVQHRKIESAGLTGYIDLIVLSDDININKPDIRLFEYAMQQDGNHNPKNHLMIGDNPSTDIAGAVNAGWHAIYFNPSETTSFKNCGEFFTSNSLETIASIL